MISGIPLSSRATKNVFILVGMKFGQFVLRSAYYMLIKVWD